MCKRCYPQYSFEQAFIKAVAASRRDHAHPAEIKSRVLAALRAEGFAA